VHRLAVAGQEILDRRQAARPPVEAGTALQQRLGIRILRVFEDPLRRTLFADLPSSIRRLFMTIQKSRIALLIAGAVGLLGACADMPDQTASRSYSMGCKATLVTSASQEISAYNSDMHKKPYAPQTQAEQDYAAGQVGQAVLRQPPTKLKGPGAGNALDDARRGC
jgi:hypothetical protein